MAEAIVNARLGEEWQASSAGTEPTRYVHPKALQVLAEIDIDHTGESKSIDQIRDNKFDLIITVCDDAAENCPVCLGKGRRHHIGFPDPAKAEGNDEEVLTAFREIRDSIKDQIIRFLSSRSEDSSTPRRD
jgi:arsenate reductase